jgi:lysyl-tRNA synthetase class 2
MLEAYEAYGSWETMADLVEGMICHVAEKLFSGLKIVHHGGAESTERTINLERPWRRVRMVDLVRERLGWNFDKKPLQDSDPNLMEALIGETIEQSQANVDAIVAAHPTSGLKQLIEVIRTDPRAKNLIFSKHFSRIAALSAAEQLQEVYEKLIEPTLIDPCFVTHVPSVIIPLARKNKDDPFFADVYELAINGVEISPGYTELNDPEIQAANFGNQIGDEAEKQKMDEDFLNALRYGMPPAGGIGLGIDRLLMMLTGAESIRDVILFPLMRPQG